MAVPVVLGSVAINLLELFVAFLQAFIFTFLTALFIGMSVVFHHDDHHATACTRRARAERTDRFRIRHARTRGARGP